MGHLTSKDAYKTLDQRLNLFLQGAPPSESLIFDNQAFTEAEEIRCCKDVPFRF